MFIRRYTNILPDVFDNYFILSSTVHDHLTRSKSDIHILRAHTTYGQKSLIYKGGTLWNSLPRNIKIIQSASLFKSNNAQ